jgi:hypothetical protein
VARTEPSVLDQRNHEFPPLRYRPDSQGVVGEVAYHEVWSDFGSLLSQDNLVVLRQKHGLVAVFLLEEAEEGELGKLLVRQLLRCGRAGLTGSGDGPAPATAFGGGGGGSCRVGLAGSGGRVLIGGAFSSSLKIGEKMLRR